jgi:hypothetical protein
VCRPLPELYHFADKGLWTKLRPGVSQSDLEAPTRAADWGAVAFHSPPLTGAAARAGLAHLGWPLPGCALQAV